METQVKNESVDSIIKTKGFVLLCIIAYLGIHQYDGKWNLPIIVWHLLGLFAGTGFTKLLSGFVVLCWLYLWLLLLRNVVILDSKLIIVFASLYVMAIYAGYQQTSVYLMVNNLNEKCLSYILPFALFSVSSILLLKSLNK